VDQKDVFRCNDFPDDRIKRVIFAHGPLVRNQLASVPRIEIITKRFVNDRLLGMEEVFRVGVPDLVKIKIGTIWKGREYADGDIWRGWKELPHIKHYDENITMSFDIKKHPPETYVYCKSESTKNFEWLKFDNADLKQIRRSTMTRLVLADGSIVMIPSMELLASAYTPRHARIVNDLLSIGYMDLLRKWIKEYECSESLVNIKTESNHYDETLLFLSLLACCKKVQSSVSKIHSSIQAFIIQREDGSRISYPVVHPYGPDSLNIIASGIWLNIEEGSDKDIFVLQRIEKFIPKAPFDIIHERDSEESLGTQSEVSPVSIPRINKDEIPDTLPVTSGSDPGPLTGRKHIRSNISVDTSGIAVRQELDKKITDAKKRTHSSKKKHPRILSSGHLNRSKDSQNVGQVHYIGKDEKRDFDVSREEKPPINPFGLDNMVNALEMLIHKREVDSIAYIDSNGMEHCHKRFCAYDPSYIEINGERSMWVSMTRRSDPEKIFKPRRLLIAKITLGNDAYDPLYLLEIERKNESESFWGVLFVSENCSVDIEGIMEAVAINKGRFVSRKGYGAKGLIDLPVKETVRFKHLKGKSIKEILNNKIDLYLNDRLFMFQKNRSR